VSIAREIRADALRRLAEIVGHGCEAASARAFEEGVSPMISVRLDLPAGLVESYESGASVADVARQYGCSYDGARQALLRAGVLRQRPDSQRAAPADMGRCRDCGERLVPAHPLGAHIPGCSLTDASLASAAARICARVG
jgi:hypothetical protein